MIGFNRRELIERLEVAKHNDAMWQRSGTKKEREESRRIIAELEAELKRRDVS